jgi:hypothetical protein
MLAQLPLSHLQKQHRRVRNIHITNNEIAYIKWRIIDNIYKSLNITIIIKGKHDKKGSLFPKYLDSNYRWIKFS